MRFVRYDDDRLGLQRDGGVIDLTERLDLRTRDPLREYLRRDLEGRDWSDQDPDHEIDAVRLESPVRRPGKIIAAPLNYEDHVAEMEGFEMNLKEAGYFLKAPSSVIGPEETIILPFTDRRCDYEIELAFVIGRELKNVSAEDAWEHILGYTILLDITVRGEQSRSNRKSFDTFTVIGPAVVTPDEFGDPHDLEMQLLLNGESRQETNTGSMVYDCAEVVEYASIGTTLEAGDVITTGTPSGVGQLSDGDVIEASIEGIGEMHLDVTERDVRFADVHIS